MPFSSLGFVDDLAVSGTQTFEQLSDSADIVIGATDEAESAFPGILSEHSDAWQPLAQALYLFILPRPFFVQLLHANATVEVVHQHLLEVLVGVRLNFSLHRLRI